MALPNTTENQGDPEVLKAIGSRRTRGGSLLRWLLLLLGVALVAGAVVYFRAEREKRPKERFITAKAEIADVRETVVATGTLSPLDAVEVGAEVTGRVVKVHADINDQVKAGIRTQHLRHIRAGKYRSGGYVNIVVPGSVAGPCGSVDVMWVCATSRSP